MTASPLLLLAWHTASQRAWPHGEAHLDPVIYCILANLQSTGQSHRFSPRRAQLPCHVNRPSGLADITADRKSGPTFAQP
ncbi:unnamed protein product [Protopolystoma xenopodis]|uniref:Secreted protein n=1 Tax=Protopolystoma xenopodis TaxID=117903 RepID=A0A3S4ZSD9_9PLAT|nr:unnamed protein product [Protopolystoma xenopodis]